MTVRTDDYAALAKDAYNNAERAYATGKPLTLNGHKYYVVGYAADNANGFHAAGYQRVDSGEIIIAIRGTDSDLAHHTLTTLQDVGVDAAMVAAKVNPQEPDARKFVEQMIAYARGRGIPLDQISITGHSAAGTLTEIEASRFGLHGETFNAYGAAGLGYTFPPDPRGLVNHVLVGDPVSAASPHLGRVDPYATPADVESLREGGYLGGSILRSPIVAARWSDHGIGNFAPAHGPGVMTAENAARAREYAAPIAGYRGEVQATHDHVHAALQPNPVQGVPGRLQTGADLVTAAAVYNQHAVAGGLRRTAQFEMETASAVERATKVAANTLAHDARMAARSIESGARATGTATEQSVAGMRQAAIRTGDAIDRRAANLRDDFAQDLDEARQQINTATAKLAIALPALSDSTHAQHAVYAALKVRLPPGTPEDRLAQCTAACHAARLDQPEQLGEVYVTRTAALFLNNSLFGRMAEVDLTRPAPPAQQSLRQIEQFDQQQAQLLQQQSTPQHSQGQALHR